jgi:alpha-1,3-rhamnosyl/mannosyltransferase
MIMPSTRRVRVGLNLLHALPEIGGGWNYIGNLLAALAEDDRNEYVAYVTRRSAPLVEPRRNVRVIRLWLRAEVRSFRILAENTLLHALALRDRLDCLHWFANGQGIVNVVPPVVSIYDLQPFLGHAPLSVGKRVFLRQRLRATVRSGAVLLPMSQTTADAIRDVLGADVRRMIVVPPVLEGLFAPPDVASIEACRSRYNLPPRFWLYVAHMYRHKNHERLLQAYRSVLSSTEHRWPLVLRGDRQPNGPDVARLIQQMGLGEHVILLPQLPRTELPALYAAASALVFPSLYEGAGMPVLEAQACGCPVIAAAIPAVREFGGEALECFDPFAATDMARAMIAFAADDGMRAALRERGLQQALRFRSISVRERLILAYTRAAQGTRKSVDA